MNMPLEKVSAVTKLHWDRIYPFSFHSFVCNQIAMNGLFLVLLLPAVTLVTESALSRAARIPVASLAHTSFPVHQLPLRLLGRPTDRPTDRPIISLLLIGMRFYHYFSASFVSLATILLYAVYTKEQFYPGSCSQTFAPYTPTSVLINPLFDACVTTNSH